MNRDELLDKLAMEVERWPQNHGETRDVVLPNPYFWEPGVITGRMLINSDGRDHGLIGFEHLADRRAELINEPDDTDAPEWARWKAQDDQGFWVFYEHEPYARQLGWAPSVGKFMPASEGKIPAGHDWQKTLREVNQNMSKNEPVKSRNEPHGITGVKHRVDRQLNPNTSSLTDSRAREYAEELKTCSDGQPCGQDDYCADCPNAPHDQDARRLDAQLANDMRQQCNDNINPSHYRQGGIECIDAIKAATVGKTGIEAACVANVIKYLWRYEEKNGVEDIEKALWYINRLHDEVND